VWVYPEIRFLGDVITYHARHRPEATGLIIGARRLSFAELEQRTNQVAQGLLAAGTDRQDRVLFLGKNSEDFFLALFGVAKCGGCFVPLNWRLAVPELAAIVRDSAARLAIIECEFEAVWKDVQKACGKTIETVLIDSEQTLSGWSEGHPSAAPAVTMSEDDTAIQLYTSGTTGLPKGVLLTHGAFNRTRLCEHLEPAYAWRDGDVFLFALPNFHLLGIGLSVQCLYNGLAISILRQFDPPVVLAAITRDRPSLLVLTPAMIQMLLDHPDAAKTDFSSLRLTMYAGSPISMGLIKRAIAAMPGQFMQFYGATEMTGAVSLLRPEEHDLSDETKLKSCGRPLPLIELRIIDANGADAQDGQPGELLVRTPAIAAGYWRQPAETAKAFVNGWYHTGDVAYRDSEGLYYIYDRLKDMIVTGGENVYSAEVENVLSTHPDVAAVAVIGVPDDRWGEAVKAVVVPRGGGTIAPADLIGFCRERLAAYKIPKSVDFLDALPLTGTGKVSKKDLRAPYWTTQHREVA
jgi:acyl-CoA synthetase (AMP-forming)/AMP-acid ligase II